MLHISIRNNGDYLDLNGGEKFANITEMVEYYMSKDTQVHTPSACSYWR